MAQNMNYRPQPGRSGCYEKDIANCNKYGRLYDWKTAKIVCPTGWHLPTGQEWDDLLKAMGGRKSVCDGEMECNGVIWLDICETLKARGGWIADSDGSDGESGTSRTGGTDKYGFAALPGGMRSPEGNFYGVGGTGSWWTASEGLSSWWVPPEDDSDNAHYRSIGNCFFAGYASDDTFDKGYGLSVRCIQN